jgi:regulator of protease activity HflC (stomatin/prohibitin superfamily)
MGWAAVITAGLLIAAVANPALADQIYKSVDAQGHVTYSDRPNAAGAQKTDVTVQQADPAEAARLAKERQVLNAEDDQRKKQTLVADKNKAQQDKDKQARCQAAKDHYNSIKDGRLYKRDSEGNRQFMSDSEADAQRETARQVMNTACGT